MATKVFLHNMPYGFEKGDIEELLRDRKCPAADDVDVMTGRDGRSKGMAIVTFGTDDDAQKSIENLDKLTVGGREITAREDRGSGYVHPDSMKGGKGKGKGKGKYGDDYGGKGDSWGKGKGKDSWGTSSWGKDSWSGGGWGKDWGKDSWGGGWGKDSWGKGGGKDDWGKGGWSKGGGGGDWGKFFVCFRDFHVCLRSRGRLHRSLRIPPNPHHTTKSNVKPRTPFTGRDRDESRRSRSPRRDRSRSRGGYRD